MEALPGPDFPTGGIVLGKSGIRRAYETGRGSITVHGQRTNRKVKNGKRRIIVTELPYMVNSAFSRTYPLITPRKENRRHYAPTMNTDRGQMCRD